ncbi:hypothetical protein BUE80_DR009298 [Diplocarpon rosae]|nr:hypothetical protein BUE80_DR009298 [Diplocarpon rosae]
MHQVYGMHQLRELLMLLGLLA